MCDRHRVAKASLLVCAVLTGAGCTEPAESSSRTIIDVHIHAEPPGDPRYGRSETNRLTGEVFVASADVEAHTHETFAAMQRLNVVKAVVSGWPHEVTSRWYQRDPSRVLVGFGIDDPAAVDQDYLRREHAAGRLHVLGEVAPQYEGVRPDDPRMDPIYALSEELDVPVALHLHPGPPGAPYAPFSMTKMRVANGNPLLLEDALVRHPKMRLYVMHAGWPFLDETIGLLYSHPQVSVEVGVIAWNLPQPEFHRYVKGLVDAGHGGRIMFGSDQMVWPMMLERAVRAVEAAGFLTEGQKQDIFCRNAARFLRLDAAICN